MRRRLKVYQKTGQKVYSLKKNIMIVIEEQLVAKPQAALSEFTDKMHSISYRGFQSFSYIIDRVHHNSPSMHIRRANTDSGGPIQNRL